MKMYKVILSILFVSLISSCSIQKKTVELANGEMVTERKYNRMIKKSFKYADKKARESVKGQMTKKQIRDFMNSNNTNVVIDTTQ